MKRKPPPLDKPYPRHRALSPDEAELWREAMGEKEAQDSESTSPSPHRGEARRGAGSGKTEPASPHPNPPPVGEENVRHDTNSRKKQDAGRSHVSFPGHLDKPTLARIRKSAAPAKATLDLHGHTKATAYAALLRFIAGAQERGTPLVLVITGKGRKGGGTLREELPRWLKESPLREAIIAYDTAGPRHGGEGAWYIRIRKKKPDG